MPTYTCEKCARIFKQKSGYNDHMKKKIDCTTVSAIAPILEEMKEMKREIQEMKRESGSVELIEPVEIDFSKKTKDELKAFCKENNIKGYSGKKNEDIIKLIREKYVKNEIIIPASASSASSASTASVASSVIALPLKMIDLFAGTGAFTLAFTGMAEIVFANDMVEHSKKIYDENFDHALTLQNLNEVENENIPAHDILTGGFPCQPFSIAGHQEGFNDERSNVFWKILSIIDHHQPKCVILENVKNLVSHDDNKTFNTIKKNLEERGYNICHKVLNTAEITGIPQHRERIYIVCLKSKTAFDQFNLDFPKIQKRSISEFLEPNVPEKYYYTNKSSTWDLLKEAVVKKNTIYQYRRVYVRENKSSECPTLTANMGTGGHNVPIILDNKGIRKLTPRECFNLQGFPSSYVLPALSDCNLYKLAGNAVSVPVVQLISQRIIPLL
jgi:DNA (cytosine-5)-methyltransferase 1